MWHFNAEPKPSLLFRNKTGITEEPVSEGDVKSLNIKYWYASLWRRTFETVTSLGTKADKEQGNWTHLTMPFSSPPAITLMDTPSGWLEKATEQTISLQWTCPTRSPFTVQSLRSLPPPAKMPKPAPGHRSVGVSEPTTPGPRGHW